MIVTYIRWRDACSEEAHEHDSKQVVPMLSELLEVGFLLAEDEEIVTIGMERDTADGTQPGRWRLHIPKSNIVDRVDVEFTPAFLKRRRK